jgi:hypothetical protein
MMRAFHDRNGVDLHIADLLDRAQHGALAASEGFGSQQSLPVERNTAQFRD